VPIWLAGALIWPGIALAQELPVTDVEAVVKTETGEFRFEFVPEQAPRHVAQFIKLASEGYYDGSAFFRVVAHGIIQGGDPLLKKADTPRNLWGSGGLNLIAAEFNNLKHERGTVSTIRIDGKPDSGGAQFFVVISSQPVLDGQYSAFGRVTEGMDVVERISQAAVDASGFTETPVRIHSVTIEKKKVAPFADAGVEDLRKVVTLKTTLGTLRIQTEPDWALEHVRQFLNLVATGWYNGTAFHRLSKGFVVQGGQGHTRSSGEAHPADRWVRKLHGEFREDLKHERGIVSMARGDDPNSATTSFFLMLAPSPHLDGKYSAFGRVLEGLDVLDAFEEQEVDGETPVRRLELVEAVIEDPA
jgi:cyclophilin family peptidyl-prolyl cis-trans isomerase